MSNSNSNTTIADLATAFVAAGGNIWQATGHPQPEGSTYASWSLTTWDAIRAAQREAGAMLVDEYCRSGGRVMERHEALLNQLDIACREQDLVEEEAFRAASVEIDEAQGLIDEAQSLGCTLHGWWWPGGPNGHQVTAPDRAAIGRLGFGGWKKAHDAASAANAAIRRAQEAITANMP